jgi:hypothetical protein
MSPASFCLSARAQQLTISEIYITEYDKRPAKKGEERVGLKNILTSPAKRGTYGFVGLNMGGKPEGVNGEFRWRFFTVRVIGAFLECM